MKYIIFSFFLIIFFILIRTENRPFKIRKEDDRPVRIAFISRKPHVAGCVQDYFLNRNILRKSKYNWKFFISPPSEYDTIKAPDFIFGIRGL
jgi:hypothetical protein